LFTDKKEMIAMAVDTRHRGKRGEISREHGNALIGALRKTYGPDFAKGCADHENLKSSLSQLIRDHEAGKLEQICPG
jgi:hypothetical protein